MVRLDADAIRDAVSAELQDRLVRVEAFAEIDSTNSYLIQQAGPPAGQASIAATCNQTAGRGQRGRRWQSPPGSGVCMSFAYTYARQPRDLSALTLAIGLAAIAALEDAGVGGVMLKWPNDLVVNGGKLAGILTESQQQSTGAVTVVSGIGVNVDLGGMLQTDEGTGWASHIADVRSLTDAPPEHDRIAGALANRIVSAFADFDANGFAPFSRQWQRHDWLLGRHVVVNTGDATVSGTAAGISDGGALLLSSGNGELRQVTSGSVVRAGRTGLSA